MTTITTFGRCWHCLIPFLDTPEIPHSSFGGPQGTFVELHEPCLDPAIPVMLRMQQRTAAPDRSRYTGGRAVGPA